MRASDFQVMPFLEVLDRDVKWRIFDSNKIQVRVLDSTLPEIIMGENFGKVRAFAKERKLAWHVKDSLISILDYYDSLTKLVDTIRTSKNSPGSLSPPLPPGIPRWSNDINTEITPVTKNIHHPSSIR